MAFVGAIGNLPISFPIADTFVAADIDAKIDRFKNHVVGRNLRPDNVVEQPLFVKISLERSHTREIFLIPLIQIIQKSTTLFIRHGLAVVGHNNRSVTILSDGSRRASCASSITVLLSKVSL
jgi:hypothetical protein